jgi:hypothetical protein
MVFSTKAGRMRMTIIGFATRALRSFATNSSGTDKFVKGPPHTKGLRVMTGRLYGFAMLVSLGLLVAVHATGQTQRTPATMDDLLEEIQGLRGDLTRSSTSGTRAQILTARLSLQEQRINDLGRQFTTLPGQTRRRDSEQGRS